MSPNLGVARSRAEVRIRIMAGMSMNEKQWADRVTAWWKSGLSSEELGYLEAGLDAAVATGYDPLIDDEPALACTLAASVTQRIAFVAHWYFCVPHMQELKVWSSFIHLPHRQTSYYVPLLSKCLLDPLKDLSLSGILFRITQKHCSLRQCVGLLFQ